MSNVKEWPLWLQLLVAIPNAIIVTFLLWFWWSKNQREFERYRLVVIPYLILAVVFYFLFGR
jgi:hypothetical protein